MGGCGMAGDERRGVVRPDGTHWQIANLSVHDGSIFLTSIGANPQLSIYGIVNRLASGWPGAQRARCRAGLIRLDARPPAAQFTTLAARHCAGLGAWFGSDGRWG